jgi:hypothetical protein
VTEDQLKQLQDGLDSQKGSIWEEVNADFEMVLNKLQIEDESDRAILTLGAFHCFSQGFWQGMARVFDPKGKPVA